MWDTIIEQVFARRIISTIIIIIGLIALFFFIRWAVKGEILPKWSYAICISVSMIVIAVLSVGLTRIYLDIKNEDYVTFCGEYIERGGGQKDLKTVVVYDDIGKEIRLLRTGPSEKGTYEGTVVYGRRSKIIKEYNGYPKKIDGSPVS